MKQKYKNTYKIIFSFLLIFLIILSSLGIWLYDGTLTQAKIKTFSLLPFPMAIVNGQPIPVSKFIFRYKLSQTALGQNLLRQSGSQISGSIIDELITEQKTTALASEEDVDVNPKQLDDQYTADSLSANLNGKSNFNDLLASYGINQSDYKNQIIGPQLLLINLQTWFYSQRDLNTQTYSDANSMLQEIQNGQDMGALAAVSTQDSAGQGAQGDLGFIDITSLLPELRDTVAGMKTGDVKIIPSRYGLNIIKLEGTEGNLLHLRQIFLKGSGFQMWYNNEIKGYRVVKLIKT